MIISTHNCNLTYHFQV